MINAMRQPLLGLPTTTACLHQRPQHLAFPCFSTTRSRLQASIQLCSKGMSLSSSDEGNFSFSFLGAWNVSACSRGPSPLQKKLVRLRTNRRVRVPRCGMATGTQVSNADWNENAASSKEDRLVLPNFAYSQLPHNEKHLFEFAVLAALNSGSVCEGWSLPLLLADSESGRFGSPFNNMFNWSIADPTFGQRVRAFCFYFTTYVVALPLFFVMLVVQPFVLMFDKHKRKAQHYINKIWASLTIYPFYKAEIEGLENLPGPDEAAVYVSNHQSFLDIYTLFLLKRPFKFISKTSNFLIPIIGWSMYLTGHVPLRRMDTRSQMDCLRHCQKLISQGVPVFFFPEGTRSRDGKMGQFKRGAFTIAAKAQVPVVPISLIGTGKLMPNGFEGTLRPGTVKVIIHPQIRGRNPDDLCEQAREVISKSLLQYGLGVH